MVTINVGGQLFTTCVETLTHFPDSFLAGMFEGKPRNLNPKFEIAKYSPWIPNPMSTLRILNGESPGVTVSCCRHLC